MIVRYGLAAVLLVSGASLTYQAGLLLWLAWTERR